MYEVRSVQYEGELLAAVEEIRDSGHSIAGIINNTGVAGMSSIIHGPADIDSHMRLGRAFLAGKKVTTGGGTQVGIILHNPSNSGVVMHAWHLCATADANGELVFVQDPDKADGEILAEPVIKTVLDSGHEPGGHAHIGADIMTGNESEMTWRVMQDDHVDTLIDAEIAIPPGYSFGLRFKASNNVDVWLHAKWYETEAKEEE